MGLEKSAQLMQRNGIRKVGCSGEVRWSAECKATIGQVGAWIMRIFQSAKQDESVIWEWPTVRGSAMNPVDHPMAAEGKAPVGVTASYALGKHIGTQDTRKQEPDKEIIKRRG